MNKHNGKEDFNPTRNYCKYIFRYEYMNVRNRIAVYKVVSSYNVSINKNIIYPLYPSMYEHFFIHHTGTSHHQHDATISYVPVYLFS